MYAGTFVPPRPGSWELESTHMTRPLSRWTGAILVDPFIRGFKASTAMYGLLLDYLEVAVIDGFMYGCFRPVGAPLDAKGPPPRIVFKLLTRLHPELRRRLRRAREVLEGRLWREHVRAWDDRYKPQQIARNRELQRVDPTVLSDAELAAHLDECRAAFERAIEVHHTFTACAMVPIGDFLAHVREWTGCSAGEPLRLLAGSSPVSVGAAAELATAIAAIRDDGEAAALLERGDDRPAETLARLRARPGATGAAIAAWLDSIGERLMNGYDVTEVRVCEVPEISVRALRAGLVDGRSRCVDDVGAHERALRERVPAAHRDAFDGLLAEARLVNRIRDERGYLNDAWTLGLARRALLEAGRRLLARDRIVRLDDVFDFAPAELAAALSGAADPPAQEIAAYAHWRRSKTVADAPPRLGLPPAEPPPAAWLPPHGARMMRAMFAAVEAMMEVAPPSPAGPTVRGLAAGPGVHEGAARVVCRGDEFARVQAGDVLVAPTTSPSYNVLLPVIGAIVTDRGGLLSHAAIVAREFGLPAVVGTSSATSVLRDGARVRVDGDAGEVTVLS